MVVSIYKCFITGEAQKFGDYFKYRGIKVDNSDICNPEVTHILTGNYICNNKTFGALVSGKKFLGLYRYFTDCWKADEILMNFSEYECLKLYSYNRTDWPKMKLSKHFEEIVGTNEAFKDEVAKLMCAYIKENNLQDQNKKEYVICDEKLQKVVGKKKIKYTELLKPVSHHMSH